MASSQRKFDPERIAGRIVVLRGLRVLLDAELARLYGVQTRTLNQAVRRNQRRFPADFLVEATTEEWASPRSQIVILDKGRGRYSKFPPLAFTEHGAIMAATDLSSARAVAMSIYIVRAFLQSADRSSAEPKLVSSSRQHSCFLHRGRYRPWM